MTTKTATKPAKTVEKVENLSIISQALEQAHEIIKEETGAPRATILVTRAIKGAHAHFTPYTPWASGEQTFNEIAFNAESFALGAEHVLGSLLHEVAHSINNMNGVKDCSSNQYHNAHFKRVANDLGLETTEIKGKGHAKTALTPEGVARWSIALAVVEQALKITALDLQGSKKPKGRNTNLIKAECACGNSLRASRGTIDSGIRCERCEELFIG
jgi:hypothetical protein